MEEAQRLAVMSPTPESSPLTVSRDGKRKRSNARRLDEGPPVAASPSPLPIEIDSGARVLELLRSMSGEEIHPEEKEEERRGIKDGEGKEKDLGEDNPPPTDRLATTLPWKPPSPSVDPQQLDCSWPPVEETHPTAGPPSTPPSPLRIPLAANSETTTSPVADDDLKRFIGAYYDDVPNSHVQSFIV